MFTTFNHFGVFHKNVAVNFIKLVVKNGEITWCIACEAEMGQCVKFLVCGRSHVDPKKTITDVNGDHMAFSSSEALLATSLLGSIINWHTKVLHMSLGVDVLPLPRLACCAMSTTMGPS